MKHLVSDNQEMTILKSDGSVDYRYHTQMFCTAEGYAAKYGETIEDVEALDRRCNRPTQYVYTISLASVLSDSPLPETPKIEVRFGDELVTEKWGTYRIEKDHNYNSKLVKID